jgi:hypothetical protein
VSYTAVVCCIALAVWENGEHTHSIKLYTAKCDLYVCSLLNTWIAFVRLCAKMQPTLPRCRVDANLLLKVVHLKLYNFLHSQDGNTVCITSQNFVAP